MKYFSQRDPQWKSFPLPNSNLNLGTHGCFATSIAMLGQVESPQWLVQNSPKGFGAGGMLVAGELAKTCGMEYIGQSPTPDATQPCIAMTDSYLKSGYPTHFYVKLPDGRRIDPYDEHPVPEVDDFHIVHYRLFRNVKLKVEGSANPFTTETEKPTYPDWALPIIKKMKAKGVGTPPETLCGNLPIYQLVGVMLRMLNEKP